MTSYAIIETGGKQLRVEPGRFYDIERLHAEPDESITIDKVLFVQNDGDISIGQPLVEGATVEGTILRHFRGRKVIVYKMRPKKKTRKKRGHRQEITRLMINSIQLGGVAIDAALESEPAIERPTIETEPIDAAVAIAEEPTDAAVAIEAD